VQKAAKYSAPDLPNDQSFPKSVRLLTSSQYSGVFDNVDIRASSRHFLILARQSTQATRLGIIVAKKNVRFAVHRNRLKRLLRESFRLRKQSLPESDVVFLAKKGAGNLTNQECLTELDYIWNKFTRKMPASRL